MSIYFATLKVILYNAIRDILWGLLSFVRQSSHLTRSAPLASATDDAESRGSPHFYLRSTEGAGRTCRPPAPHSSSHEAVAASNIPLPSWNPSESKTVHSEVEVINNASRTINLKLFICFFMYRRPDGS